MDKVLGAPVRMKMGKALANCMYFPKDIQVQLKGQRQGANTRRRTQCFLVFSSVFKGILVFSSVF